MPDPVEIVLLCAVVFATGVVGTVTGGNSLVNVPALILAGVPPRQAVATNMFAVTFMTLSATVRFARAGLVKRDLLVVLGVITAVTSALGARLTVTLSEGAVKTTVAISMGLLAVFLALRSARPEPAVAARISARRRALGLAAATVLGIYGGLYSGGYTTLLTMVCVAAFGLTLIEAVAITKPINLISCAAASVVFLAGGLVDLRLGLPLAGANLVGGWVGAHLALARGERFLRALFLGTVVLLAAKLLVVDVLGGRGAS
jgi:hypothetical protein